MKRNYRAALILMLAGLSAGCTGLETVPAPHRGDEYVLACDKAKGRPSCEAKVNEICPGGFETLSSEEDFERRELRVRCLADDGGDR